MQLLSVDEIKRNGKHLLWRVYQLSRGLRQQKTVDFELSPKNKYLDKKINLTETENYADRICRKAERRGRCARNLLKGELGKHIKSDVID